MDTERRTSFVAKTTIIGYVNTHCVLQLTTLHKALNNISNVRFATLYSIQVRVNVDRGEIPFGKFAEITWGFVLYKMQFTYNPGESRFRLTNSAIHVIMMAV